MKNSPVNNTASIRARLLTEAKRRNEQYEYALVRYASERLLYRLGKSPYCDQFIIKGATLFACWTGVLHRPTRDLDFLAFGDPTAALMAQLFREISTHEVEEDGLVFDPNNIQAEQMRENDEYQGVRITLHASLGSANIAVRIDLGFGDAVSPAPIPVTMPTYLDMPAPMLRAYPRVTVVAEKLQAMVRLGLANSRLKDFYDLWFLCRNFNFDGKELAQAVNATFERRSTPLPSDLPVALTPEFTEDQSHQNQWQAFLKRSGLGSEQLLSLVEIAQEISSFIFPVINGLSLTGTFSQHWSAQTKMWND